MYTLINMNYITTTQLRTKTSDLVSSLKKGARVFIIHRSKVIGVIEPVKEKAVKITDVQAFKKFLKGLKPKKIIPRSQREKIYREHMMKKYGKGLS